MEGLFHSPEILRYLGVKGEPAAEILFKIERAKARLMAIARPRSITRLLSLAIQENSVVLGDLHIESAALARHLKGCVDAVIFAATLGAEVDRLAARLSRLDIGEALVFQAAAASMIERFADEAEQPLKTAAAGEGLFLRPRFSPGYGDFDLSCQAALLRTLDADRRIGLTKTNSHMLAPLKSVTAVIGRTRDAQPCYTHKCALCANQKCPFREEDQ